MSRGACRGCLPKTWRTESLPSHHHSYPIPADGANNSNDGRGYVPRRVLRRAVRYGHWGRRRAWLCKLVPTLAGAMGGVFLELIEKQAQCHGPLAGEVLGVTLDKEV
jgi:alanyl-tRNA synthetase